MPQAIARITTISMLDAIEAMADTIATAAATWNQRIEDGELV